MDRAELQRSVEQLAAFHEIGKALTSTLELREVLSLGMQKVSELLRPSHWSLLLCNEATGELYFEVAVGSGADALQGAKLAPSEGIAGQVFTTGEPRLVADVTQDPDFAQRFDTKTQFTTRSILAVPLKSRGKVLGVVELVKGSQDAPFTPSDLAVLCGVGDYLAIAIENARNFRRIQELTITDEHTGLFNSRHMRAVLDTEVTRARRFAHPLTVLFLDLDHFKIINDTHGHLVGSAVLREVGETLVAGVRQVDPVFRYGGDEFALLLLETDLSAAQRIAERLCSDIAQRHFQLERGLALRLTASIGVASLPQHASAAQGLVQAADRAMYSAKAGGRNGVRIAVPAA